MAKEKKTDPSTRNAKKKSSRRFDDRRDRFVDSFQWGFVAGDEDGEELSGFSRDNQTKDEHDKPASGNRKTATKQSGNRIDRNDNSNGTDSNGKNPKRRKKMPKKITPSFPLFEDDEDEDDLNLPSYGRTPVPTEAELPEPAKRPIRQSASSKDQRPKAGPTDTFPKRSVSEKQPNKSLDKSLDKPSNRPERVVKKTDHRKSSAERDRPVEHVPETEVSPGRLRKEQMVWDPDKREYVPLEIPKPAVKPSKSSTKSLRKSSPRPNRDDPRDPPSKDISVEMPSRRKSVTDFSDDARQSQQDLRSEGTTKRTKRTKRTKQQKKSDQGKTTVAETPDAAAAGASNEAVPVGKDRKRQGDSPKGRSRNDSVQQVPHTGDDSGRTVSANLKRTESRDDSNRKERRSENVGRNREDRRPAPRRADVPPMVESNVPDPADIESEAKGFAKLGVSETMLEALKIIRFLEPTPIQAGVFQQVKSGLDVMGQAQTGTGKTAAFSIPIIEGIEECPPGDDPVAMILVPTRELAVQVRDEASRLGYGRDVRITACYGGKPIAKQIARLKDGVDILVGTPGRVLDLMNRKALSLDALRWVVLDEADRMLDIGFRPDIEKILRRTPKERQTLLFSATLAPPVVKLAEKYMNAPEVLDFSNKGIAVETIEQFYITVDQSRKFDALVYLLNEQQPRQAIIFTRTKRGADRLARLLLKRFDSLAAIHGDLSQGERDRVMGKFRAGKLRYLVATDVVGRGIDVSGISHIINYDIPAFCDDYVHRVGRTGRMGREGVAYTFVTVEEGSELTRIEMRIDKLLKRAELKGFESFTKPEGSADLDEDAAPEPSKPVYGKSVRKIRRAL